MSPIDPIKRSCRRGGRRFWREKRGNVAIEFALVAPLLLLLIMGVLESGRFLMTHLKTQHASITVADLVTRDETIDEATVTDLFNVVAQIMKPYPTGTSSVVIVSAISKNPSENPKVFWKRTGAGSLSHSSILGSEGSTVTTIPGNLSIRDNETIIVVEIYYQFEPFYFRMFQPQIVSKFSYFRPRIGALQSVAT
ncbi:MAG: pilus assembly protein [Alphaproteobacteria bacterium]|jgi:Flp pilus assembly protein TadG|nr:pilus assembly protein [Alphaproteobacteria bacterium]